MRTRVLHLIAIIFCLATATAAQPNAAIPRAEYPRPQFEREQWMNLNGAWTYEFDLGRSGMDRELFKSKGFTNTIVVPFCPESRLSGVAHTDFIPAMWYHRSITVSDAWNGKNILIHFGAVDFYCELFVNGRSAGKHWGGSSSFQFDITKFVKNGAAADLVLYVEDDQRSGAQGTGKQSGNFFSNGCMYTRTTGIWQTVWLEAVSPFGLERCTILPDLDNRQFVVKPSFYATTKGNTLNVKVKDGAKIVSQASAPAANMSVLVLPLASVKPWSPEHPFLYDIIFEVTSADGKLVDRVQSYAGLRKIHIEGNKYFLNNEPIFLRLVLDQGFYPEGVWTAPSDAALKHDIEMSMDAGFNGARLHQKVFEERFHYWADKLGYLTWGEFPSWGLDMTSAAGARNYLEEWRQVVMRDCNSPSIVAWSPFNETYWGARSEQRDHWNIIKEAHDRLMNEVYDLTRTLDPSRPVNETSGFVHVRTDLYTVHNYDQTPAGLQRWLENSGKGMPVNYPELEVPYAGQPYIVDEYGGIKWIASQEKRFSTSSWGYGQEPKTVEEYYARLDSLTNVILGFDTIAGYCYTQLTDVEQEQNGVYNYDRSTKFDMAKIRSTFSRKPAAKK